MVAIRPSSSNESLTEEIRSKPADLSHLQLPYRPMKTVYQSNNPTHNINDFDSNLDSEEESDFDSESHSANHHSLDGSSDESNDEQSNEADNDPSSDTNPSRRLDGEFDSLMPGDELQQHPNQSVDCNPDDQSTSIVDIVDPGEPSIEPAEITEKKPATWMVLTALVTAQLCWSGFHVIAKSLFNGGLIPPSVLPSFRTLGVIPVQAAWAYHKNPKFYVMPPRHHYIMLLLAVLGNTISQQFFNFGESLSSATLAGSMQPLIPCITTVFAIALKREKFNWLKALGVVIAVAGSLIVVLLGSDSGSSANGSNPVGGAMCFLVQTVCTALYITIQKPFFSEGIDLQTFNFYLFLYGGIGHIIIGAVYAHEVAWSQLPWTIIPVFLYVSIVSSFFAFMFFVFATKHLPASISSLAICLQSFFSPALGAIFLGESMSLIGIFGGLTIVAGIVLVVYIKNRETKHEEQLAQEKLVQLQSINSEIEMLNTELEMNALGSLTQSINPNQPNTSSFASSNGPSQMKPFVIPDDEDSGIDEDGRFGYPQKSVQLENDSSDGELGI